MAGGSYQSGALAEAMRRSSALLLPAVFVVALSMAMLALWAATSQPWLGARLAWDGARSGAVAPGLPGLNDRGPGGAIVAIAGGGDAMRLEPGDLAAEPGASLASFSGYHRFLDRQDRLAAIIRHDTVSLIDGAGGKHAIAPAAQRPLHALGAPFWVQVFVGVVGWLIAASVWVFRRDQPGARYLLLSGAATLVFATFSAVYGTRELALPAPLFRAAGDIGFLGSCLFAASVAALLLYYPRTIAPLWVGRALVAVTVWWWAAQELDLFVSMALARHALVAAQIVLAFALALAQWRLTARDPAARAALQWFLMAWLIGVTAFDVLVLGPQLVGIDTSAAQGYGVLLILLVYGGLALGVLRYRLFDLGEWWFKVIGWLATMVVLVVVDVVFAAALELSPGISLALALLFSGLVWLPLRTWMWRRTMDKARREPAARMQAVLDAALAPSAAGQEARWREALAAEFRPLAIEPAAALALTEPRLVDEGTRLAMPGAGPIPALVLVHADNARRLFGRHDLAAAAELHGLLAHSLASRDAFEAGAKAERTRIAGDIHDNVQARLLTALHTGTPERKDALIRETLADLRSIINDISTGGGSLHALLAALRRETAERLAAQDIALDWMPDEGDDFVVSPGVGHALQSIIREAVSNAIRHSGARLVTVEPRREGEAVRLTVEDDGVGLEDCGDGNGMAILRRRVGGLRGTIAWGPAGSRGTRLDVLLPIGGSIARPMPPAARSQARKLPE